MVRRRAAPLRPLRLLALLGGAGARAQVYNEVDIGTFVEGGGEAPNRSLDETGAAADKAARPDPAESARPWEARFLDEYPLAVCNDGTPAAYWYRAGLGWSTRRWVVFLEGGGWCWSRSSCEKAWLAKQGSSKNYPRVPSAVAEWARAQLNGIFSDRRSPLRDAHMAYVRMCSNDAYMGDVGAHPKEGSAPNKPTQLHFRGQRIVEAVLADLRARTGMGELSSDSLLFGGCSAGGRGALIWLDRVAETMAGKAMVFGLFDSMMWMPLEPLKKSLVSAELQNKQVLDNFNATRLVGEDCGRAYPDEPWRCLLSSSRLPFVRTPLLISHSQYDNFGISMNTLGSYSGDPTKVNSAQQAWAERYRTELIKFLPRPHSGSGRAYFSSACYRHCTMNRADVFEIRARGVSLADFMKRWLSAPSAERATMWLMDDCEGFNCGTTPSNVEVL